MHSVDKVTRLLGEKPEEGGLRDIQENMVESLLSFLADDLLRFAALKYGRLGGISSDPCIYTQQLSCSTEYRVPCFSLNCFMTSPTSVRVAA